MTMPEGALWETGEQQYQLWRHSPSTAVFLKYLKDQADAYRQEVLNRWEANSLDLSTEHEYRGVIRTLEELSDLPLSVIKRFYGVEDEAKIS